MLAFLSPAVVVSCELRDESAATSRDRAVARDALADSAARLPDPAARPRSSTRRAGARAGPSLALPEDTGSFATPLELAELSAALEVPLAGITRLQLRDTYAELRGDHVHEALDIPAARGTLVLSATDGRLLRLFDSQAGGLMVYAADASDRFILYYGHLDGYAEGLSDGMRLERGQQLGYVGTTGNALGGPPHLHFGILRGHPEVSWSKGVAVNPYPLLVPALLSR